jgi:hypothetical protein
MRIIPQIIAHLRADTDIAAQVENRIFADYPPQGVDEPFIVLTILSGQAYGTVDNCSVRAYSARLEIDVLAETRAQTESIIELVENSIDGFTSSDSTHPIQGVTVNNGIDWELLVPKDGSDERRFLCSQDYEVHYTRNIS